MAYIDHPVKGNDDSSENYFQPEASFKQDNTPNKRTILQSHNMLDYALAYGMADLRILPVAWIMPDGSCSCGRSNDLDPKTRCKSPGKHALIRDWPACASSNIAQIMDWWTLWPKANIGLFMQGNGLVCLDVDIGRGKQGDKSLINLLSEDVDLGNYVKHYSGSGGLHLIYRDGGRTYKGSFGSKFPNIDIRHNSYILMPPSNHWTGGLYREIPGERGSLLAAVQLGEVLAEMPASLLERCENRRLAPKAKLAGVADGALPDDCCSASPPVSVWDQTRHRTALAVLDPDKPPNDISSIYEWWLRVGMGLHRTYKGHPIGLKLWSEWSRRTRLYNDPEGDCLNRWETFGKNDEGRKPLSVATISRYAAETKLWRDPGREPVSAGAFGAVDIEGAEDSEPEAEAAETAPSPSTKPKKRKGPNGNRYAASEALCDLDAIPTKRFVAPFYVRGKVSLLVGAGGTSKSTLALTEALAIVTGRPEIAGWPDGTVTERASVLYLSGEDDRDMITERIAAAQRHFNVDLCEIDGSKGFKFHIKTFDDNRDSFIIAKYDEKRRAVINQVDIDDLSAMITENKIGVVILDPLNDLHGVNENDNGDMKCVANGAKIAAHETGAAFHIVHHAGKPSKASGNLDGDANMARGASSLASAMRGVRTMREATPQEAKRLGRPGEHTKLFRVDEAKNTFGAKNSAPRWFERGSVRRANGVEIPVLIPVVAPSVSASPSTLAADLAMADDQTASVVDLKAAIEVEKIMRRLFSDRIESGVRLAELLPKLPADLRKSIGEEKTQTARNFRIAFFGGADMYSVAIGEYTLELLTNAPKPATVRLRLTLQDTFEAVDQG